MGVGFGVSVGVAIRVGVSGIVAVGAGVDVGSGSIVGVGVGSAADVHAATKAAATAIPIIAVKVDAYATRLSAVRVETALEISRCEFRSLTTNHHL